MMAWPQITLIVLLAIELGIHLAKHGEPRAAKFNFIVKLVDVALLVGLLYAGGFFA